MSDEVPRGYLTRSIASQRGIQPRLDGLIREHRFTIAVVFPVIGAILLVLSAEGYLPEVLAFNAFLILFGTLIMRSPLLVGMGPLLTKRTAGILLGIIGYTYLIEIVAIETGVPYGVFEYLISLGPMIAGVPLALPLFFIPLVVNAYLLAILLVPERTDRWFVRIPLTVTLVIAIDLILDPAAVAIGFWSFASGGAFYGVPVSNYLGWMVSGTIVAIAIDQAIDLAQLRARARDCDFLLDDLVSFILLWGVINVLYGQLLPILVTGMLIAGLIATGRYDGFLSVLSGQ